MKLYFAPNSRALRVAWALEELSLPYELVRFDLGDPAMRSPEYLARHPMGRVPAIEDGNVSLIESGAILQYLLARYDLNHRLHPTPDSIDFAPYLQWLHYAEGMLMPPVNAISVETIFVAPARRSEMHVKRATKLLQRMFDGVEAHLDGREHLAGNFSAADIMSGHSIIGAVRFGVDLGDRPRLAAYLDRLQARPAYQRAASL